MTIALHRERWFPIGSKSRTKKVNTIQTTATIALISCLGLAACMSDQGDNRPATPQTSEQAQSNATGPAGRSALAATGPNQGISAIVPELADHPTGAYVSLSPVMANPNGDRTVAINLATAHQVAGFQFRLRGGTPIGCQGGRAGEVSFNVVTSEDTGIVIGHFNTSTTTPIASGGGVLTNLTFRPDPGASELCLTAPVIGDPQGEAIDAIMGGCLPLE